MAFIFEILMVFTPLYQIKVQIVNSFRWDVVGIFIDLQWSLTVKNWKPKSSFNDVNESALFCKIYFILPITGGFFEREMRFAESEEIRLYNVNMVNKFLRRIILDSLNEWNSSVGFFVFGSPTVRLTAV